MPSTEYSMVVLKDGSVYGCGNNKHGVLTIDSSHEAIVSSDNFSTEGGSPSWVKLNGLKDIIKVSTGPTHALYLDKNGDVFANGTNDYGEVCPINKEDPSNDNIIRIPVKVSLPRGVKAIDVMASRTLSVVLTEDKRLLGFGRNNKKCIQEQRYEESGSAISETVIDTPTDMGLTNVKSFAIGYYNVIALLEDNTVWTRGYNDYGELGVGNRNDVPILTKLINIRPGLIKDVFASTNGCFILFEDGEVYATGSNSGGALGLGSSRYITTFTKIINLPATVSNITISKECTLFHMSDDTVYLTGRSYIDKTDDGDSPIEYKTPLLFGIGRVKQLCANDYNLEFIDMYDNFQVVGSNRYGQLGLGSMNSSNPEYSVPILSKILGLKVLSFSDESIWSITNAEKEAVLYLLTKNGWVQNKSDDRLIYDAISKKRDKADLIDVKDLDPSVANLLGKVGTIEVDESNKADNFLLRYDAKENKLVFVPDLIDRIPPDVVINVAGTISPAKDSATLSWTNPTDVDFAGVKIVKKVDGPPIDVTDGTIIYTGTDESFVDSMFKKNVDYFYGVFPYDFGGNFNTHGNQIKNISSMVVDDLSDAPGPKGLIGGDLTAGYFGPISQADFITAEDLIGEVGLTQGYSIIYGDTDADNIIVNENVEWLKFAIDGKIIFRTKRPIRLDVSWDGLNALGCVDGTKVVTIGTNQYKVRLIRGALNNPAGGYSGVVCHGSEWNRLLYPINHKSASLDWWATENVEPEGVPSWGINFTDADMGFSYDVDPASYYQICMEEATSPSSRIYRGEGCVSSFSSGRSNREYMSWSPVLELINPVV